MAVQGIFASNQGIVGERAGDFASAVLQIGFVGTAVILAMTAGMAKEDAVDTVFHWYEDSHVSGRATATAGGTTTTVVVDDGSFYISGTVMFVEETGEYMYVTVATGNSLTVSRGMGGTTITSITNGMHVQAIGNAHEEGSGMPTAVTQQGAPRLNYTQIFRNGWAITGTAKAVKFHTGSKIAKNKADAATYHAEDMERAFIYGRKHLGQLNGKQFRLTDGILSQITQYGGTVVSAATDSGSGAVAGNLSWGDFGEFMRKVFAKNVKGQPNERIAIAGDLVLAALNRMAALDGTVQVYQPDNKFGLAITTFVSPFGKLTVMTHPLMNENPVWQHELYVLHPGGLRRRVLRETNREGYDANGLRIQGKDADEGVITTEVGIEVAAAETMGILKNVQKAVKTV